MHRPGRMIVVSAVLTGALVTTLWAGTAASAAPGPDDDASDTLSGRLLQVTQLGLSDDPAEASRQIDEQSLTLGTVNGGPASLQVSSDGIAVTIFYTAPPTDVDLTAIRELGTVDDVAAKYLVVDATIPAAALATVAALPNIAYVVENIAPTTSGVSRDVVGTRAETTSAARSTDSCRTIEANLAEPLNVPFAREVYDVDGTGVKIGIISDSYATRTDPVSTPEQDIAAGLLPGAGNPCGHAQPVQVVKESRQAAGDEGRAMAQLVHSIAPGATLLFASGLGGQAGFVDAVGTLADAGADVIVDDLGYSGELMFQDGPASTALSDAVDDGIPFFTAAGNDTSSARVGPSTGHVISSWETPEYRPTDCPPSVAAYLRDNAMTGDCLDFSPSDQADPTDTLTYPNLQKQANTSATIMLQWAQAVRAADTQLMAAVLDSDGEILRVTPSQPLGLPLQMLAFEPDQGDLRTGGEYDFVVVRNTTDGVPASLPRVKAIFTGSYVLGAEYFESEGGDIVGPSIYGHAGSPSAVSVVAANAADPSVIEPFSGTGPLTLYFEPFPSTKALPQPIAGAPTLTGLDGAWTNFFGSPVPDEPGTYSFTGTSAAAPSAAAVAALGLQKNPDLTPAEVTAALTSTSREVPFIFPGVKREDVTGSGLVDAAAFLSALPAPTPTPTPVPPTPVPPTPVPTPTDTPVPQPTSTTVPVPNDAGGTRELGRTGTSSDGALTGGVLGALLLVGGLGVVLLRRRRTDRPRL